MPDEPNIDEIIDQWLIDHVHPDVAPAARRLIYEERAFWWPTSLETAELRRVSDDLILAAVDLGNQDHSLTEEFWKEAGS